MIDISMKAEVKCSDGRAGHCSYIIVNPVTKQMTHLVVKSDWPSNSDYMVPVDQVEEESASHLISLKCSLDELKKMEPFTTDEYLRTKVPAFEKWEDGYVFLPNPLPPDDHLLADVDTYIATKKEHTPPDELAVQSGAQVEAMDGHAGKVDELLINSNNKHITHLIIREGPFLKTREVAIPVLQIENVERDRVHLKLDKKSLEELPTAPVQRWEL